MINKKLILTYISMFLILIESAQAEFGDLPTEIKFIIAKHLSRKDLLTFSLLSQETHEIANHESLWKNRILLDFGKNIGLIAEEFKERGDPKGQFILYKEFYKTNYLDPILYIVEDRLTQKKISVSVRYFYGEPFIGNRLTSYDVNDLNMRDNFIIDNFENKIYILRRNDFKQGMPYKMGLVSIMHHQRHHSEPIYININGHNNELMPACKNPYEKVSIKPYSHIIWQLDETDTHLIVTQIIYQKYLRK